MEQALTIDPDLEKELSEVPQLVTNVNFVQLCGPIVEVVDEKLQFVHFTVHEYELDDCPPSPHISKVSMTLIGNV